MASLGIILILKLDNFLPKIYILVFLRASCNRHKPLKKYGTGTVKNKYKY